MNVVHGNKVPATWVDDQGEKKPFCDLPDADFFKIWLNDLQSNEAITKTLKSLEDYLNKHKVQFDGSDTKTIVTFIKGDGFTC